jgi:hypothetical protein
MIRSADPKTRPQALEILDAAKDLGLKVLRIWAFNDGPIQYNTLQRYPGEQHSHQDISLVFLQHMFMLHVVSTPELDQRSILYMEGTFNDSARMTACKVKMPPNVTCAACTARSLHHAHDLPVQHKLKEPALPGRCV